MLRSRKKATQCLPGLLEGSVFTIAQNTLVEASEDGEKEEKDEEEEEEDVREREKLEECRSVLNESSV